MTRVEELFHAALAKPLAERAGFLEQACSGDAPLRAAVESLLAAHEAPGSFLNLPPNPPAAAPSVDELAATRDSGVAPADDHAPTGEHSSNARGARGGRPSPIAPTDYGRDVAAGAVIGRYTLQEKIGEGGMGEVWVARQTEPVKRKVALKLIKAGMDSRTVLQRFEQERQALALMDHPHIARVLDGGMTPLGQPFFVMELVNGLPLTRFCDEAKLTPKARLELFVPICQAVQHAHQKGIVHRDLKPANILVTMIDGKPVPKVIDFGVAKATSGKLTEETMWTGFGAVVGTLEYMSPEQARFSGEDIDTRADIYSLGVILYELLTGLRPIDAKRLRKAALTEMIRIIQEEEPSKPSTRLSTDESLPSLAAVRQIEPRKLTALLRGELDWVVMKCLEKQRDRRYETANALARDVQRYLADEVVEARPPSVGYRLKKFVRRHKGQVLAASLVLLALAGGILGTSLGMLRAERARTDEEKQRKAAEVARTEEERQRKTAETARRNEKAEREKAQELAKQNEQLADNERAAKQDAEQLAKKNAELADDERTAREQADAQLLRTRSLLFTSQLDRAKDKKEKDPNQALALLYDLSKCPFESRDLAWNFSVHALRHQLVASVQLPPSNHDVPLAWSPDGKLFATHNSGGVWGMQISLIEVDTGKVRSTLPEIFACREHTSLLLAFSPDGGKLAVAADGSSPAMQDGAPIPQEATSLAAGMIQIWDVAGVKKLATLEGHTDGVLALAFSPESTLLATGGLDKTARVWDVKTAGALHVLKEHGQEVGAIAFSPDGKRLATGGGDNTVRLWDVEGFQLRSTWAIAPSPAAPENLEQVRAGVGKASGAKQELLGIRALQFSPDGAILASSCASQPPEFRNVSTGDLHSKNSELKAPLRSLVFHRDGQSVLTTSVDSPSETQWFALNGRRLRAFPGGLVDGSGFRREQSLIATRTNDLCEIWDLDLPLEAATIGLEQPVTHPPAVFGLKGEVLAVGEHERIVLYDVRTGKPRKVLTGHEGRVNALALSPDGLTLASSAGPLMGLAKGEVRLWNFATGEFLGPVEISAGSPSLAFSADGSTLALLHGRKVETQKYPVPVVSLWNVKTRQAQGILEFSKGEYFLSVTGPGAIAFNPADATWVAAAAYSVTIWNTKTREIERRILSKSVDAPSGAFFLDMAVSPDGKSIATINYQPGMWELALWDPATGTPVAKTPFRPKVGSPFNQQSIAFSPSGRELITCVMGEIQFWDVRSLQERATILDAGNPNQKPILDANRRSTPRWSRAILSPDGRVLATLPHISRASPGTPSRATPGTSPPDTAQVLQLFDLLTDSAKPQAASNQSAQIELWDLSPPAVLLNQPMLGTVFFSRDSRTLIENRKDGVIRFWDLAKGSVLTEVNTTQQAIGNALSPDGRFLAGTYSDDEEEIRRNPKKQGECAGTLSVYEIQTKKLRRIDIGKGVPRFPVYSPSGQSLAFIRDASLGDKVDIALEIWDFGQARIAARFPVPRNAPPVFSPDGNTLALITSKEFISLFDLPSGSELAPLPLPDHRGNLRLKFTNDGKRLVFRQDWGITKQTMWDWRAGKQVDEPIPDVFDESSTSPDGRYRLLARSRFDVEVIDRTATPAVPRRSQSRVAANVAGREEIRLDPGAKTDPGPKPPHAIPGRELKSPSPVDEAIASYRKAIELNPKDANAHGNLGNALMEKGQLEEAIACCRKAIELDPNLASAHCNLGAALQAKGQLDEAIACHRKAVELDPKLANAHASLGGALRAKGQLDEAIACLRKAVELDPRSAGAHYNLGGALRAKGRSDEALACLRTAVELDPNSAYAQGALGQALLDQGRYAEAKEAFERALALLPPGHPLRAFASEMVRSCERFLKLEERLPQLLRGEGDVGSSLERLDLVRMCQAKQRYAAATRFAAAAFTADPKLADNLQSQLRYNAACCAALAASGEGQDAPPLDDAERTRHRQQALDWLKADLTALGKLLDSGPPQARTYIVQTLSHWQQDPDLASIRDVAALAKLTTDEQPHLKQLWADVAVLLKRADEKPK